MKNKFGFKYERSRPFGLTTGMIGLSFLASACAAFACPAPTLFQDSFSELNPIFKSDDGSIQLHDKKLIFQAPEGQGMPRVYGSEIYDHAEVCATISAAKPEPESRAGLIFWAKNYSSYYVFEVNPAEGTAIVARWVNGSWLHPVPAREFAAIKRGPGDSNELRVAVDGSRATLYVNDQKFGTIQGSAPEGGGQVGLYGDSSAKAKTCWTFANFGVSKVRFNSNPPLPAGPTFEDNFAKVPADWIFTDDSILVSAKDNRVTIQNPPNASQRLPYNQDAYSSGEIRVKVTLDACQDGSMCDGGVTFWGTAKSHYSFTVSPLTGKASIVRFVDGRWLNPVPSQESPAIKKGLGQTNELRLAFNGSQATAYINGQKFATYNGQAPEDGGTVGLRVQSPTESPSTWGFTEFKLIR